MLELDLRPKLALAGKCVSASNDLPSSHSDHLLFYTSANYAQPTPVSARIYASFMIHLSWEIMLPRFSFAFGECDAVAVQREINYPPSPYHLFLSLAEQLA